jgi:hypothetical protein
MLVGVDDKSGGPNAWKPLSTGGFVHSFESHRRSPVFDATAGNIRYDPWSL